MLPKYSGVKVVGSSGSWYEIQYTSKKGTSNQEEFQSNCLIYDGREKRPFANGTYHLSFYQNKNSSAFSTDSYHACTDTLTYTFKYVGNNCYTIKKANEDKYLKSDTCRNLTLILMNFGELKRKQVLSALPEKGIIILSAM